MFSQGTSTVAALDDEIAALQARLDGLLALRERAHQPVATTIDQASLGLYQWQRDALQAWRAAGRHGVVQAVTGAGKTRVGVAAIAEAIAAGRRAVVIVPTLVLVRQWLQTLAELLPGVAVASSRDAVRPWSVLVTTVQTAMGRHLLQPGESALVVADECHRYGAGRFADALYPSFAWRLGLTATLRRDDDGDHLLDAYFGGIVHDVGYGEASRDGLIAPFRIAHVGVPLTPEERVAYDELTDDLSEARLGLVNKYRVPAEPIGEFLREVSRLAEDRTPRGGGGLARLYLARFSARRKLLAETSVKQEVLAALAPIVQRSAGTIVFTQTKESSLSAVDVLVRRGCSAVAIHGEVAQEERDDSIDLFARGDVAALAAPRVLDEGVDVPDADLGIVLAANRSRRQMVQRLGRVLRRREGKVARFVVLHADDTVEDPFTHDRIPDFYRECAPYAQEVGEFSIGRGELGRLIRFLGGDDADVVAEQAEAAVVPVPDAGAADPGDDAPTEELAATVLDDDPIKGYFRQIGRHPLLTAEDEVALTRAIEAGVYAGELLRADAEGHDGASLEVLVRAGAEARERMICSNLRLVVSLAKRYTGRGMDFLDLIQEGNLGLMHAVEMFDFAKGNKFSTYATWWIKQAIVRGMADKARTIRLPVHFDDLTRRVDRHRRELCLTWRELLLAYPDGIAEFEARPDDLVRMVQLSSPPVSLDALLEPDDDEAGLAPPFGDGPETPESWFDAWALTQRCERLLQDLRDSDPRGEFILRARFGFLTGDPETLDAVGVRVGLTRERIRQLEKLLLQRLAASTVAAEQPASPAGTVPRRAAFEVTGDDEPVAPRRAVGGPAESARNVVVPEPEPESRRMPRRSALGPAAKGLLAALGDLPVGSFGWSFSQKSQLGPPQR